MNKIFQLTSVAVSVLTLLLVAGNAQAVEVIESFDVSVTVNEDATIQVMEEIAYNFGEDQRHGIYRDIPVKYKARGGTYKLRVSEVSVVDDFGDAYAVQVSQEGSNLRLKIGDADTFVTGIQNYVIEYTVDRALNYFDEHDELYWNVTGEEWEVPIRRASTKITLPQTIAEQDLQHTCLVGITGATQSCAEIKLNTRFRQGFVAANTEGVDFKHPQLEAGEGMTVVVGWPKGIVYEPTRVEKIMATVKDNWIVGAPFIALIVMGYLWWTRGRDPKGRGTIVPQYEPPKELTPSQVGTLVDERADNADLTADIIDLAVKGWLKIIQEDKKGFLRKPDFRLKKLREPNSDLSSTQQLIMTKLFEEKSEVKLSDLKQEFASEWKSIKASVYDSLVDNKYFAKDPGTVRMAYAGLGVLVAFAGVGISMLWYGVIGIVSSVVTGIIIGGFGVAMPAKTKKGVLAKEYIEGLKRYLTVAEKERLKFHNAPEKKPEHFDALLPYAMALGVEKEWAKQFEGIEREDPSWYQGPAGTHFNAVILANSMGSFSTSAGSNLSATASSGGSGFSGGSVGGGFGGGGGGSW